MEHPKESHSLAHAYNVDVLMFAEFDSPPAELLLALNTVQPTAFYRDGAAHRAFFWHRYDQVLLRPDVLPYFDNADLSIITTDGESSLLNDNGMPDKHRASDHLPILFKPKL